MVTEQLTVKSGYKQTEVGIIPEDWDVVTFGDISKIKRGASPRPIADPKYFGKGRCWIRISDITKSKKYLIQTKDSLSDLGEMESVSVNEDDVIMSIAASVGKPIIIKIKSCIHDGFIVFLKLSKDMDSEFLYYMLINMEKTFLDSGQHGTQSNINSELVSKTKFVKPKLVEQERIGQSLSDIDEVIQQQDHFIQKKKNIRQGVMQELLTGKRRLEGFNGEWILKKFGDVLKVKHGKSQKEIIDKNGQYPILATGGKIGMASKYLYDKPSALIGRKGTIDKPQYMDTPFWTVDTLFYTEMLNDTNPKFVFYKFMNIDWYSYNEASGVPSLNSKTIENIEQLFPPSTEEQKIIVKILTDMDSEIEQLEIKKEKYIMIKNGMMQKLLTGEIRLT